MNNSFLERAKVDTAPQVQEREAFLVRVIEAIVEVEKNSDWKFVRKEIFDPRVAHIERLLAQEFKKPLLNEPEVYRLQGRLQEAERFQIDKLVETFKVELENIRKRKNENS